jgi:hypothetical protein
MIDYEAEILKLKDNNAVAKLKAEAASRSEPATTSALPSSAKPDKQAAALEARLQKRDQDLVRMKEKEMKNADERRELTAQLQEVENKLAIERRKAQEAEKEKEAALKSLGHQRQRAEEERFKGRRYKEDHDQLLAERQGTGAGGGLSYSE